MSKRQRAYRRPSAGGKGSRTASYRPSRALIAARRTPLPRQRGFLRTGGFYGRYANGGERKFWDVDVDDAVITAGANVLGTTAPAATAGTLVAIPQGVTESTRVGRKCVISNIGWRFQIGLNNINQGVGSTDTVRVILYLDKQANGAIITNTDLLESADYQSFNNLSNSGRFRVLMDRTYTVKHHAGGWDGTGVDYAADSVSDTFFKRCSIPLEFSGTTGALTELRSNNLAILLCGQGGVAFFNSKMRFRFHDG